MAKDPTSGILKFKAAGGVEVSTTAYRLVTNKSHGSSASWPQDVPPPFSMVTTTPWRTHSCMIGIRCTFICRECPRSYRKGKHHKAFDRKVYSRSRCCGYAGEGKSKERYRRDSG